MLHKLCTTSLIAFLPFQWQMPFAMIIITLYLMVILVGKPYLRKCVVCTLRGF